MKRRVAIIGTQGVPARYGGFESLAENLICSDNIDYTVYCSSKDLSTRQPVHKGARLRYIPLKANGIQSVIYDIVSLILSLRGFDAVLLLGVSGAIFIPIFRLISRAKVITNVDGLDHRRAKWGTLARWFLKLSERIAVRFSHTIVADNKGIVDYLQQQYATSSELIAYGGDQVLQSIDSDKEAQILNDYKIAPHSYALALCRIEPENNCHIILEAAAKSGVKMLFIGNWSRSKYSAELYSSYSKYENITLLNPIYDLEQLFVLRSNAARYIHGHSAGGTNPSLVEAMFFGREVVAFDVIYNRETTLNSATYFSDTESLTNILSQQSKENSELLSIAQKLYRWSIIRAKYENLF